MKKFKFRFESVERIRKSRESEALVLVGQAQRILQREREILGELESQYQNALERREQLAQEAVSPQMFALQESHLAGVRVRILESKNRIRRANRLLEQVLQKYLEAKRNLRAMEIIREKDLVEYRRSRNKYEQKQFDELALMRLRLAEEEKAG